MFSSYERLFLSLTLRICTQMGLEHGLAKCKNHALVGSSFRDRFARRETEKRPSNFFIFLRRPWTEEDIFTVLFTHGDVNLPECVRKVR
jgi:hypothetical protein